MAGDRVDNTRGDKGSRPISTFLDKLDIFHKKDKVLSEGSQNDYRDPDSGPAPEQQETAPMQPEQRGGRVLDSDELPTKYNSGGN